MASWGAAREKLLFCSAFLVFEGQKGCAADEMAAEVVACSLRWSPRPAAPPGTPESKYSMGRSRLHATSNSVD